MKRVEKGRIYILYIPIHLCAYMNIHKNGKRQVKKISKKRQERKEKKEKEKRNS